MQHALWAWVTRTHTLSICEYIMCVCSCVCFVCVRFGYGCVRVCVCVCIMYVCVFIYTFCFLLSVLCVVVVVCLWLYCTYHIKVRARGLACAHDMSMAALSGSPVWQGCLMRRYQIHPHTNTPTQIHTPTHTHKDTHTETLRSLCINVVGRTDCVFTPETARISLSLSVLFTHSLSLYLSPRLDIKQERCFRNGSFLRFLLKTADDCTLLFTKTVGAAGSCLKLWVEENAHSYITLVYCFWLFASLSKIIAH